MADDLFGRLQARPFTPAEQGALRNHLALVRALCHRHWPAGPARWRSRRRHRPEWTPW
ncbi:hypothetical protein MBH78_16745 [Oceanimonas sp. NS1]|nr:hypothetical protein [Oceanimonas sp. NS1]